jgi:hypothetical protein
MMAAELQESFARIPIVTKARILFFEPFTAGTARKKKTGNQENFT